MRTVIVGNQIMCVVFSQLGRGSRADESPLLTLPRLSLNNPVTLPVFAESLTHTSSWDVNLLDVLLYCSVRWKKERNGMEGVC